MSEPLEPTEIIDADQDTPGEMIDEVFGLTDTVRRMNNAWLDWRVRRYRQAVRRMTGAVLLTLGCYAWLFDRIDPERAWWQILLGIVGCCIATTLASLLFAFDFSILVAVAIGYFTPDLARLAFGNGNEMAILTMSFLPLAAGMVLLPLLFRIPKQPDVSTFFADP